VRPAVVELALHFPPAESTEQARSRDAPFETRVSV